MKNQVGKTWFMHIFLSNSTKIWTQSLIPHKMLTFAGATNFDNIKGNRF